MRGVEMLIIEIAIGVALGSILVALIFAYLPQILNALLFLWSLVVIALAVVAALLILVWLDQHDLLWLGVAVACAAAVALCFGSSPNIGKGSEKSCPTISYHQRCRTPTSRRAGSSRSQASNTSSG
jgi:hypothetical protein